jgi:hypothetical protein
VSSGWLGHLLREFSMRKNVLFAVAISAAALAVASPAMAAKFQIHPNIILLSNGVTQTNGGHQSGVNSNVNPFQVGVNAAILTGFNNGQNGSQTIDQTQTGGIAFPFLGGPGQVNLAGNLEIFSFNGNTQKVTQKQDVNVFLALGGPVQRELGLNVTAFGSGNSQTVDQSQTTNAFFTIGNVQQQAGANVVLLGDNNTQSVKQTQTENAFIAGGSAQQQLGVNAVIAGDNNNQSITQSQTDNSFAAGPGNQTQIGANVVLGGNNNTQTVVQDQ